MLIKKRKPSSYTEEDIYNALRYMDSHGWESIASIGRLFGVPPRRLIERRDNPFADRRSLNKKPKFLSDPEIQAIHHWILHQYFLGWPATRGMIQAAATTLLALRSPPRPPPGKTWMDTFTKSLREVKKTKTKPLDIKRKLAQNKGVLIPWFNKYRRFIADHHITPDRLWNFDEAGFRVGMVRGEVVYVPKDAPPLYTESPEDRRQVTLIESVSAVLRPRVEAAHAALFGLSSIRGCSKANPLTGRLGEHFSVYNAALLPPHFSLYSVS